MTCGHNSIGTNTFYVILCMVLQTLLSVIMFQLTQVGLFFFLQTFFGEGK